MLPLAPLGLSPGDYGLQVIAENSDGVLSAPAQANVTLVAVDLSNVQVFPNPWRKDRHTGPITFGHLTTGSVVKVFTVSGHHVKTLPRSDATVTWDLTNENTEQVASGLYLYLITAGNGQQRHGKLSVIH